MVREKRSSIALSEATRKALEKKKLYKRETYEDIIKRIVLGEEERQ